MSFIINYKLSFIDSFQFLSFSLDSFVKSLNNDDFKYLRQEFDKNKSDLVKRKGFCSYEYMSDFEKLPRKVQEDVFLKFILNILKSNENYIMILSFSSR